MEISLKPINIFLDFNAVIVNIDSLPEETRKSCLANIEDQVKTLKSYLEENLDIKKNDPEIPEVDVYKRQAKYNGGLFSCTVYMALQIFLYTIFLLRE